MDKIRMIRITIHFEVPLSPPLIEPIKMLLPVDSIAGLQPMEGEAFGMYVVFIKDGCMPHVSNKIKVITTNIEGGIDLIK